MTTQIAVNGAGGRMGKRLVALASIDPELKIVAALEHARHPDLGKDAGLIAGVPDVQVPLTAWLEASPQAVIDFSVPEAATTVTRLCVDRKIPLVMATTGLTKETKELLARAAEKIPVVYSPSMSTTVNLAMRLVAKAAEVLKDVPAGADVEIIERHHRMKEDAPSGTAIRFGEIVAAEMGISQHRHGRHGQVGKRPRNEIGYHAVRVGDNAGEHTVIFGMFGESLEITVKASNRDCYATGALAAAKFVAKQKPGMYSMYDVLGL
ncbi:MAG TPA: 4-hydroxy-tetrahydrodipicolinate reductase [Pirellulaceae bacterium]|nr:4-hydroxy-tetrahydrodipicolinate reductase [Pirellulaceae bacterium]